MSGNIALRDFDPQDLRAFPNPLKMVSDRMHLTLKDGSGICYTAYDAEGILACAGVMTVHPGVGEAWCILPRHPRRVRETVFLVRTLLHDFLTEPAFGYHRIQATMEQTPMLERWARFLRFKKEGQLRRYGMDGADHTMYAMTR